MQKLSVLFIWTLIVGVAWGEAVPKRARVFLQDIPPQFSSLVVGEFQRQQVPLRIITDRSKAQFLFTATLAQQERRVQASCELTSARGEIKWSGFATAKVKSDDQNRSIAERKMAQKIVSKLAKEVQGHETTESRFHTWWPSVEEAKKVDASRRDERPRVLHVRRDIPRIVDVDWENPDTGEEDDVAQITVGMTTDEVEEIFGVPQRIARVGNRLIYRYPEMVVEFLAKKVSTVRF